MSLLILMCLKGGCRQTIKGGARADALGVRVAVCDNANVEAVNVASIIIAVGATGCVVRIADPMQSGQWCRASIGAPSRSNSTLTDWPPAQIVANWPVPISIRRFAAMPAVAMTQNARSVDMKRAKIIEVN